MPETENELDINPSDPDSCLPELPPQLLEDPEILNEFRKLIPKALQRLSAPLENDSTSEANLLKVIGMILDRACGKPGSSAKTAPVQETLEESESYIMAVLTRAREKLKEETQE